MKAKDGKECIAVTPATADRSTSSSLSPSDKSSNEDKRSNEDVLAELVREYSTSRLRAANVLARVEQLGSPRDLVRLAPFGALLQAAVGRGRASVQEVEGILAWLRQRGCLHAAAKVPEAYLHCAKALAHRGALDKAELLMVEMGQQGIETGLVAAALFDTAVRTSRFDRAWWMLERALQCEAKVDKVAVSLLLKRGQHNPQRLALVEQFILQQRQDADEVLFNSLLAAYCRAEDMGSLERVCASMMAFGVPPSAATFGTLLKAYGQKGDFAAVKKTWESMKLAGIGINSVTYGCMLDASVRCKQFSTCEQVFQELRESGMHRNTILFSTMIKAFAKRKDLEGALALKAEMIAEQVPLNCVTYNSLIDVAVRCREYKTALGLLDEMEGAGLHADLITYSTLIKGLTDLGMLTEAMQLFVQVESSGFKVDEILVNSLLDGCVKAKAQPQVALALVDRMRTHRIRPSQVTLAAVVKVFAVQGQYAEALAFLQGHQASEHVLSTLVRQLLQEGFVDAAARCLGLVCLPLQVHAQVLPVLVQQKKLDEALTVIDGIVAILNHGVPRRHARDCGAAVLPALQALAMEGREVSPTLDQLVALRVLSHTQVEPVKRLLAPAAAPSQWASGQVAEFVPGAKWHPSGMAQWWKSPLAEHDDACPSPVSPKRRSCFAENAPENIANIAKDIENKGENRFARKFGENRFAPDTSEVAPM